LDHIVIALFEYSGEKEKQLRSLDLAEDHLRRASIESIEILVIELFFSIYRILKQPRFYYRLVCFSLPDKRKIDTHIKTVEYHLQRGRQLKGKIDDWELCLRKIEKAYDEATILKNLLPDIDEARYRFLMIFASIIAILVSVTVIVISSSI
jgi:hypothetical protein